MRRLRIGGPGLLSSARYLINKISFKYKFQANQTIYGAIGNNGFDEGLWEENYTFVIEEQIKKAGNPGQETLLGDDYFAGEAKDYCRDAGMDYNPEDFVSAMQDGLRDDRYNAISVIIDECAEELIEAWDYAFSNDGIGEKLFGSISGGGQGVFGSFQNAAAMWQARTVSKYGGLGTPAHQAAKRKVITKFLRQNPNGRPRNDVSWALSQNAFQNRYRP